MVTISGWKLKSREEIKRIFQFCEEYKSFLNAAKTEREATGFIERHLRGKGFGETADGQKMFRANRSKQAIAFLRGEEPLSAGMNIITAHIDAPRLDLKQNPLYEEADIALLRTHYYGGIKKYHWVAIPLAIHGVIVKGDGTVVEVSIGEKEDDPVFTIDDLLPHLSRRVQDEKKLSDAIDGEKLALLFGSMPLAGEERDAVKQGVLDLLRQSLGITEEDLVSAELEVVPAFPARDVGIDRGMIGGYGQDDRISAYPLLRAITDCATPKRSCVAIFTDKEEIGSEGNTGMKSNFLHLFLYDVLEALGMHPEEAEVRRMLFASKALSADVNAAFNPTFPEVHERQNASFLGRGVCLSKFTGHGGKVGASDAHAEYVGDIRRLFDREGILWHAAEMGKVDEGGGGTVAKFLAEYGMDIIDCGPSLLSMHSPFEVSSKLDVFETYRAFKVFFESC
jgi:aspartyl aminopeptidase